MIEIGLVVALCCGPYGGTAAGTGWATEAWREWAAGVVAGEVRGVPAARMAVACTLVRDVAAGWDPWRLGERWYGWHEPGPEDRAAVEAALAGGCEGVRRYRFVGSLEDARMWQARGWVEGRVDLWLGPGGQAVVAVPVEQGGGGAVGQGSQGPGGRGRLWPR